MSDASFIITLDGPAGVGKSTLARRLADALEVAYLDTGAMFRTIALHLAKSFGGSKAAEAVEGPLLQSLLEDCVFSLHGSGAETRLLCNGRIVGDEIRSEEAGMMAAKIATLPQVREYLKSAQQRLGQAFSLVAEGRDMGTVVFPQAGCKIFLEATPEIRAERRCRQLCELGQPADYADLVLRIRQRDEQDRNRAIAPLRPAPDAVIIDTSGKDIEAVFSEIMQVAGTALKNDPPDHPLRRKDRALDQKESLAVLERGEYGVLAVQLKPEAGGWPYAVPLSYVLEGGKIYFHCAHAGRKITALASNPKVCLTVVADTEALYDKGFTTNYASVMVFGRAAPVLEEQEKRLALEKLAEKYLPQHMDKADADIRHAFKRTAVYAISLDLISGKARRRKGKE